jgi:AcrR family transcriptional regulator
MARTGAPEATVARTRVGAAQPTPIFRRAKPQDALDVAQATFLAGDRVDVGILATQLAVSRATVYRWFGTREQLLEQVLAQLAGRFSAAAGAEAQGEGDERVIDFARRIMYATARFEPVRTFITREPQLALRLLIGQHGAVHRVIARALLDVIGETSSQREAKSLETHIDGVVRVATALQWAAIAIGEEAEVEDAVEIVRMMLDAGRASTT